MDLGAEPTGIASRSEPIAPAILRSFAVSAGGYRRRPLAADHTSLASRSGNDHSCRSACTALRGVNTMLTSPVLRRILLPVGPMVEGIVRPDRRCAMRRNAALWLVGILAAAGSVAAGIAWAQTPVAGGTVVFAAGADPDSLDPQNTQSNPGGQGNRKMDDNLGRFST